MKHDSCETFSIYISTHTDPERGDLHFMKDEGGAASVKVVCPFTLNRPQYQAHLFQLLGRLLPNTLLDVLKKGKQKNLLTFLVCGGMISNKASSADLKEFTKK